MKVFVMVETGEGMARWEVGEISAPEELPDLLEAVARELRRADTAYQLATEEAMP